MLRRPTFELVLRRFARRQIAYVVDANERKRKRRKRNVGRQARVQRRFNRHLWIEKLKLQ